MKNKQEGGLLSKYFHNEFIGPAVLALSTLACSGSESLNFFLFSPDPLPSLIRGFGGTFVLEIIAFPKLIKGILEYTTRESENPSIPLGCLALSAPFIIPGIIGLASIKYPEIGYCASVLPLLIGVLYLSRRGGKRH